MDEMRSWLEFSLLTFVRFPLFCSPSQFQILVAFLASHLLLYSVNKYTRIQTGREKADEFLVVCRLHSDDRVGLSLETVISYPAMSLLRVKYVLGITMGLRICCVFQVHSCPTILLFLSSLVDKL